MAKQTQTETKYSDSITTKNRGVVRLTLISPEARLQIGNRWVSAKDIPLNAATLTCGHLVRGIALALNDVVFCETCQTESFTAEVF